MYCYAVTELTISMFDIDDIELEEDDDTPQRPQMMPMILPEYDERLDFEEDIRELSDVLPLLPMRTDQIFPYVAMPLIVGRDKSKRLLDYLSSSENKHILVATQKDATIEEPTREDLIDYGVIAEVMHVADMGDGMLTVVMQGKVRVRLGDFVSVTPFVKASYTLSPETVPDESDMEYRALAMTIKEVMIQLLIFEGDVPKPFIASAHRLQDPTVIINFSASNFPEEQEQKVLLLLTSDMKQRGFLLLPLLNQMAELQTLRQKIRHQTQSEMDKQQRDYFLQQQMQQIRKELSDDDEDQVTTMLAKGAKKKWPAEVSETFHKEVAKLRHMSTQSPDYSVQLQYCQTILDLPWDKVTKDNFNIQTAQRPLDKDHFGLEKVKERILEHLSVLKLKGNLHAPILCLYGPPGVGKTSLGKSIARALGRKYVRISLGGMHDEAEIRGHRRTYIGAMPGRIIKGFLKAGSGNPVFVLDEVDKLANDYKGDPSSALLEVLDPEQNNTFHDNYLDLDYDLSRALFIATANNVGEIPGPLRDRMEMIEVSGYIPEEKVEIAKRHLIPNSLDQIGLRKGDVKLSKRTIDRLIEDYTLESGVRQLDKRIRELLRKLAKQAMEHAERPEIQALKVHDTGYDADGNEIRLTKEDKNRMRARTFFPVTISPSDLPELLGPEKYKQEKYEGNRYAGVVTGLAWTSVGGVILLVESAAIPSRQGRLSMTGNLGAVMKESATLALEYVKSHADLYGIDADLFDYWDLHIHVPEGAIPKDGPSAGITIVTSLISTLTQRQVKPHIAMTGEITLRGKVLPVGGIKEKILAAKRAGIKTLILCEENKKDIDEIKAEYLEDLSFVYVRDISEVIDAALSDKQVDHPVDLMKRVTEARERQHKMMELKSPVDTPSEKI